MAQLNTGFAFTDPVAAQQAVQMYQLRLAAEDALRRNAQENIRTFAAQNTAKENASQQRALTQSQMAQRDRELGQNQRQFDATQDYRLKSLDANKTLAESDMKARRDEQTKRDTDRAGLELFNALQNEVSGPNPPTDLEFAARTVDVDPQRKEILNRMRLSTIGELTRQADVAARIASKWNTRLAAIKPEDTISRDKVFAEFEKSKDRNVVELDPSSNMFRSLISRPRTDPVYGPEQAPANAQVPVIPIQDVLNRVQPQSAVSRFISGLNPVTNPLMPWNWGGGSSQPVAAPQYPVGANTTIRAQGPPPVPVGPIYGPEPDPTPRLVYPQYLLNGLQPNY